LNVAFLSHRRASGHQYWAQSATSLNNRERVWIKEAVTCDALDLDQQCSRSSAQCSLIAASEFAAAAWKQICVSSMCEMY
jgi:hypothetical protein